MFARTLPCTSYPHEAIMSRGTRRLASFTGRAACKQLSALQATTKTLKASCQMERSPLQEMISGGVDVPVAKWQQFTRPLCASFSLALRCERTELQHQKSLAVRLVEARPDVAKRP